MGRSTYAVLVLSLALAWQYITVKVNYGGNWTALFCTGDAIPVPDALEAENVYVFQHSYGFDAQFYHYIAHDPIPPGDLMEQVELPGLRYRRILLPWLAYALSLGNQRAIDLCYVVAGFFFVFLGTWWMGRYASQLGLPPAWSLVFPLSPAVIVFVDRLTVDHALAALTVAFALFAVRRPSWQLYVTLMLAPLARETGLLLTAGYCLHCLIWRHWKSAAIFATSGLPWLGWVAYVAHATGPAVYETSYVPFRGVVHWLLHPVDYPEHVPLPGLVQAADILGLLGIVLAIGLAAVLFWRRKSDPVAIAAVLFAAVAVFVQRTDVWETVFNYGRIFTPLLLLVAVGWMPQRPKLAVLPMVLMAPRLLMQYGNQVRGVANAVFGG